MEEDKVVTTATIATQPDKPVEHISYECSFKLVYSRNTVTQLKSDGVTLKFDGHAGVGVMDSLAALIRSVATGIA